MHNPDIPTANKMFLVYFCQIVFSLTFFFAFFHSFRLISSQSGHQLLNLVIIASKMSSNRIFPAAKGSVRFIAASHERRARETEDTLSVSPCLSLSLTSSIVWLSQSSLVSRLSLTSKISSHRSEDSAASFRSAAVPNFSVLSSRLFFSIFFLFLLLLFRLRNHPILIHSWLRTWIWFTVSIYGMNLRILVANYLLKYRSKTLKLLENSSSSHFFFDRIPFLISKTMPNPFLVFRDAIRKKKGVRISTSIL